MFDFLEAAFEWNKEITAKKWLDFVPKYFNCSKKAKKVDVLFINGRNDILVPPQGMITTKLPTDMDV